MEKLSIKDVSKRRRALENKRRKKNLSLLLKKDKLTFKEAQEVIENFESIHENQIYAFEKVLEIFQESYRNNYTCKNDLELQRLCNTICNIMPRLETTANPIHDLIIHQTRESRNFAKRALKNAKKYMERAVDPKEGSISDKDYQNHKKKDDNYSSYKVTLDDAPSVSTFSPNVTAGKVQECYEQIQETAKNIRNYDRVLDNHRKLCKRFNINDIVENAKDYELCVYELCELIDSYDMPFEVKYNVALENVLYLFELNNKFYDKNPKEVIDEFFYTRDLSTENLQFMENIIEENRFYYEKKECQVKRINEFDLIIEESKENPVKKLIDDFKKEDNKSIEKMKKLINSIYTKSPQQIIDGTPNFLTWLRTIVIISVFSIQPLVGLIVLFTDRLIALHLKRNQIEKVLKNYKSEINKVERKLDKTNNEKTKERLNKYHEELSSQYSVLKEYSDSLKTERELDEEDEIYEACLAEGIFDKITVGEELDHVKKIIQFEFKRVLERLRIASKNKYKRYFDNGTFYFVAEEEINNFLYSFDKELGRYLDAAGNICMSFCKCNIEELFGEDFKNNAFSILDDLSNFCKIGANDKVNISYEGTGNEVYLIFTYLEPLYISADIRSEVRENYFHPMTFNSLGTIVEISNIFETMEKYPINEFIEDLIEEATSPLEVQDIIKYLSTSSLFSIDETTNILMAIRENTNSIHREYIIHMIDRFVKESVNMNEPEFDLETFKEDVEIYTLLSEGLKETIAEKIKQTKEKAAIKKDETKDKLNKAKEAINKKASAASVTAQLGAQAAKGKTKELDSKQRQLSKQLDDGLSVLAKRIEQAAISKNREQIIKGSVLPSASRIIKNAITFGAAWAVNPAIAAIGALSMLFVSKNATKRERALILDEIDIELKIVERKIARAEAEDNDEVVRNLYQIQNKLRREKQRLKYRMAVYYNQKPIGTGKGDDY